MGTLSGRVAVVTGAARGQGRSHALALAEQGADVVVTDLCEPIDHVIYPMPGKEDLEETVRLVEAKGVRCTSHLADVRSLPELIRVVDETTETFGKVDIFLANAGIVTMGPIASLDPAIWQQIVDINLTGAFNSLRAVLPGMIERHFGRVVVTSSMAGRQPHPGVGHYVATKFGVIGLVKAAALETAAHGVTVNAVCPTNVNTPMFVNDATAALFRPDLEHATFDDMKDHASAMHPIGVPYVEPEDVTAAVMYLVSDGARYVTGEALTVAAGSIANSS